MLNIYLVAAFWFLSALTSTTLIANKFFLPEHLLEKPVLDDQLPDIIKARR
jgi:hypothetical protein